MNLNIHITEQNLRDLMNALKISEDDYELMLMGRGCSRYAKRIIEARNALGLSTQKSECVAEE